MLAGARVLALVGLLAMLLACASTPQPAPDVLRIGIAPGSPPLAFLHDGEPAGLEADFARQLAVELGLRAQFVVLQREALLRALESRRVDILMSGLVASPTLRARVAFARPYLRSSQMALIRREDAERLGLRRALLDQPLSVGFETGSGGEVFVRARLARARPVALGSVEDGLDALRERRIDVFISDAPTVWRVSAAHREGWLVGLFRPLTEEYLAWALRPDDPRLTEINVVLRRWERTGVLEALLNRWMPLRAEVR
jgi:ABC-type amino acid transport substrate-binding protein